jgi:hypothetical protein
MIVFPGPAFVLIPLGISILASEFKWAKNISDRGVSWLSRQFTSKRTHRSEPEQKNPVKEEIPS